MDSKVSFYKDDTVYHLKHDTKQAYIGTIVKSDKLVHRYHSDDLFWDKKRSDSEEDTKAAKEENLVLGAPEHVEEACSSDVETKETGAIKVDNGDKEQTGSSTEPNIEITWTELATGDEFTKRNTPIPMIMKPKEIKLLERDHMIGDAVKHATRNCIGTVAGVHSKACAELLGYNRVVLDLDCNRLRSVKPYTSRTYENHVIYNGWFGHVLHCEMLAIIRFTDGARLLVRGDCLDDFDPTQPTRDAFPDSVFEGAWLRGKVADLKSHPTRCSFDGLMKWITGQSHRGWSVPARKQDHRNARTVSTSSTSMTGEPDGSSSLIHGQPTGSMGSCPITDLPPGHPLLLEHALKSMEPNLPNDEASKLSDMTPLFLTETRKRNAKWFSRVRASYDIVVYVERFAPTEVKVHWFDGPNPKDQSPPPDVIRGADIANLKAVYPYPHHKATGFDIYYVQLQPTDTLYDLKAHDSSESLLYKWLVNDRSGLDAVRSTFPEPSKELSEEEGCKEVQPTEQQGMTQPSTFIQPTPWQRQRALLSSSQPRSKKVIANARHRLTHSDMITWSNEQYDGELNLSDSDDLRISCKSTHRKRQSSASRTSSSKQDKSAPDATALIDVVDGAQPSAVSADELAVSVVSHQNKKSKSLREAIKKEIIESRRDQLVKLQPGTWVAMGLYSTYTEYDVRWQDGSVDRSLNCGQLLPLYFNMDEHELFPGSVVTLKNAKNASPTSDEIDASSTLSRDIAIVLAVYPEDRLCRVQWFHKQTLDNEGNQATIPVGDPEEIGVYELTIPREQQLTYGDVVLTRASTDPIHASIPAGYVENVLLESGKLLIRWIDGAQTEVDRTECLIPLSELLDDDDSDNSSDSDHDGFDFDHLSFTTDSAYSDDDNTEISSDESDKGFTTLFVGTDAELLWLSDAVDGEKSVLGELQDEPDVGLPWDEVLKKTTDIVIKACELNDSIMRVFLDPQTFVCWMMEHATNSEFDHLKPLLAAVGSSLQPPTSDNLTRTILVGDKIITGTLVDPKDTWDHAELTNWRSIAHSRTTVKSYLLKAYEFMKDFRFKRMYACDLRSSTFERYFEKLWSIFERPVRMPTKNASATIPTDATAISVDRYVIVDPMDSSICNALRRNQLSVLVISQLGNMSPLEASKNKPIYWATLEGDEAQSIMIINSLYYDRIVSYIGSIHQRLLNQMSGFTESAMAWLGEMAPEMVKHAQKRMEADLSPTDLMEQNLLDIAKIVNDLVKPVIGESGIELSVSTNDGETSSSTAGDEIKEQKTTTADSNVLEPISPTEPAEERRDSQVGFLAVEAIPTEYRGDFIVEDDAPSSHQFYKNAPSDLPKAFHKAWRRDNTLLSTSLPRGIIVKSFGNRIDLYSLLIVGSTGTPYELGLFLFDIQLPSKYPDLPPIVHYHSFAAERLNPNLYVEGHVCLSLLGTWSGRESENWDREKSNLLQLVVSLQGLILNSEPYFNEAGFDACRGQAESVERSRIYNESVVVTQLQSTISMLETPIPIFRNEIIQHYKQHGPMYASLLEFWASLDKPEMDRIVDTIDGVRAPTPHPLPEFPLTPVTRGFQLFIRRQCQSFLRLIADLNQ